MRKILARKPDPVKVEQARNDISELKEKESNGEINLAYFDESGFSLTPSVPHGWQNIGE